MRKVVGVRRRYGSDMSGHRNPSRKPKMFDGKNDGIVTLLPV